MIRVVARKSASSLSSKVGSGATLWIPKVCATTRVAFGGVFLVWRSSTALLAFVARARRGRRLAPGRAWYLLMRLVLASRLGLLC